MKVDLAVLEKSPALKCALTAMSHTGFLNRALSGPESDRLLATIVTLINGLDVAISDIFIFVFL